MSVSENGAAAMVFGEQGEIWIKCSDLDVLKMFVSIDDAIQEKRRDSDRCRIELAFGRSKHAGRVIRNLQFAAGTLFWSLQIAHVLRLTRRFPKMMVMIAGNVEDVAEQPISFRGWQDQFDKPLEGHGREIVGGERQLENIAGQNQRGLPSLVLILIDMLSQTINEGR